MTFILFILKDLANTNFLNENEFLWTSEKDGYNHIYLINYSQGTEKQLTKGNWDVTKLYGYDKNTKEIYFQAAKKHPTQREIYTVNSKTKNIKLDKRKAYWISKLFLIIL